MESARISYDASGNMLIEGIKLGVRANSYKVSDYFKNAVKNIELQLKNGAVSEEEYLRNIEKLRNQYLEKGTKEWWSYTNKLIDYENKQAEAAKKAEEKRIKEYLKELENEKKSIEKIYSDIASVVFKEQKRIEEEQERFAQKLSGYTEPFYSVKSVFVAQGYNGQDLKVVNHYLSDLDEAKKKLKEYKDLLDAVRIRGEAAFGKENFEDFFYMLRDMTIEEGSNFAELLLKENDEGFSDFVSDWNEIQKISKEFSKEAFEDETKSAVEKSIKYMSESLSRMGYDVPEGFFTSGSIAAERFGEGFVSKIDSVMEEIRNSFDALMPDFDILSGSAVKTEEKNIFAPTYNIAGGGESTMEKLKMAISSAIIEKLRGGY